MSDLKDFKNKNTEFTGTKGIDLPEGTTAQRVNESGNLRFNSETNLAEYYTGTEWKSIDSPPTISSISVGGRSGSTGANSQYININESLIDSTDSEDIVISGTLFDTAIGSTVTIIGTGGGDVTPTSTTVDSSSQITLTVNRSDFSESNDPYTIRVTNPSGLFAEIGNVIDAQAVPVFSIESGTLATVLQNNVATIPTPSAVDADGDTITYSISAGALPSGLSINSSTAAITGTPDTVETATFTVQAATSKGTTTRDYQIIVNINPFLVATGGTESTEGDFKIHTFTGPGTFTVTNAGLAPTPNVVDYLVVGGGGGGRAANAAGGGGAGGFRLSNATGMPGPNTSPLANPAGLTLPATSYPITVGGGGSGSSNGATGANSVFSTITSAGGGCPNGNNTAGLAGGSGGGGIGGGPPGTSNPSAGGTGNSPPTSPPQGNTGGRGFDGQVTNTQGGGGGGAGAVGGNAGQGSGAPGGVGSYVLATGFAGVNGTTGPVPGVRYFSGGGGGGTDTPSSNTYPGGSGGGGQGGNGGVAGSTNTGGGGGGGPNANAGGSGIVIIRYKYQ